MKNNTEKDWTGNKNSIFKTLGASNHTDKERQNEDYYATDPIAIDVLLKDGGVTFNKPIWECSCGEGHLSERLKSFGYEVRSTDLIDRGYGEGGIDFLTYNQPWNGDILTNPPYKYAKEFIEHAMTLIPDGCRVFMFLKVQFLEGKARKELFKKYPPKCVYVSSSRILCAKNALFDEMRAGGGSVLGVPDTKFIISGEEMVGWNTRGEYENFQYAKLTDYLCYGIGASQLKNVCACCVDLAKYNDMTMAELFEKYGE